MALDTLRRGAGRFFGVILLGLLVISFAIWGIADIFTGYGSQTLIKIGDTEITQQDYMRTQQEVLRSMSASAGRSLSIQEARTMGLDNRVLERLIGGAAVDNHAEDLRLAVGDDAILQEIMKDPSFQDSTGQFSPIAFQQALRTVGLTEQGYLASQRERNLRRQLLSTVGKGVTAPQILLDALNRFNSETRTLRYVLVPDTAAGAVPEPTEEQLKSYYDNHRAKFTQPEFRKLGLLAVTPESVRDQVQITENDLKTTYEADKGQLGNPERRQVQQIPFADKAAADAALQKIQSGTDFMEVAKQNGLSEGDVDLGLLKRGDLADPAVAEVAFAAEENKVSGPVTGKLGSTVLLRVTKIEPGKTPTFEEAKPELEKKLLKERATGAIFDLHDKIEDERASGTTLAEIAGKFKLKFETIDQVDRQGRKPDGSTVTLPAQQTVLDAAFSSDSGVENDPIDAKDEGVIWYDVLGVVPQQVKPFDQAKEDVAKAWRTDEVRTQLAKFTQDLVNALSGGKTLEDVAKELNAEVMSSDPLKRNDIGVNVLKPAVAQAFTLPQGGFGSAPSGIQEGRIVFQVDKITPPEPLDAAGLAQVKQQLGLFVSDDIIAEYFGALEGRYGVSVNQEALAKLTGTGEQP
ncbi:MAG: peptidyl-prolyl cis-trans isomerase [Methyloceanibacter sp.]|uniref:peptidylprolyl isomerase n=1 Tax=Methyloceanibacter sp. TaxID=1965321 RepID=UPI003D9BC3AD